MPTDEVGAHPRAIDRKLILQRLLKKRFEIAGCIGVELDARAIHDESLRRLVLSRSEPLEETVFEGQCGNTGAA